MKLYEMVKRNESFDSIARIAKVSKNINERSTESGWTALMFAINNRSAKIVDVLIENGADVNIESLSGITPIKFARMVGNQKIVSLLIKAGAQ